VHHLVSVGEHDGNLESGQDGLGLQQQIVHNVTKLRFRWLSRLRVDVPSGGASLRTRCGLPTTGDEGSRGPRAVGSPHNPESRPPDKRAILTAGLDAVVPE
jgi:hypothetical protein